MHQKLYEYREKELRQLIIIKMIQSSTKQQLITVLKLYIIWEENKYRN